METSLGKFQPQVLSILRIIAGLLFLSSGLQKWFGFSGSEPELRQYHIDLDDRHRRTDRDNRRRASDGRPVYASRGLHNVGRDGSGVLVLWEPTGEGFYADPEWRHAGSAVLFRFFLLSVRWCRRMEPRRHAAKEGLVVGRLLA